MPAKTLNTLFIALALTGLTSNASEKLINRSSLTMFQPLPDDVENSANPFNPAKLELGKKLFFDARLSLDHKISCYSCHDLFMSGVDNLPVSTGISGQKGQRSAPSVFNAALQSFQNWDGRAADVETQAKGPILAGVEMGMPNPEFVVKVLKSIPDYVDLFQKAFPKGDESLTFDNVGNAIGAFERKLLSPSRFDKFLKGDDNALTIDEKVGLKIFLSTGCATCHNGVGIGGHMFQKLGLVEAWPGIKDKGRSLVTGDDADDYRFKVSSLRNIVETEPYLHDGSIKQLDVVVKKMAKHQLGKTLSDEDTQSIITFLNSLTGEVPDSLLEIPDLPENGINTPKPERYIVK